MKLRFFNGRNDQEDSQRLNMLNEAIRASGLHFTVFEFEDAPVRLFDKLCERMAIPPTTAEPIIAMLHLTGCPGLANEIGNWNIELRRNLVAVLFSGDSLSEATVKSVLNAGNKAEVGRVLWLKRGLFDTVSTAEFKAFFTWLAAEKNPTLDTVCKEFESRLPSSSSAPQNSPIPIRTLDKDMNRLASQELLRPITLLCEGAIAVHEARAKANPRVPQIAFDRITAPRWWRECLGLTTHEAAERAVLSELQPKLPSQLEKPPVALARLLEAAFAESPISEQTVRAARDYCRPLVW